jgi:hypothetical protein
MYQAWHLCQCTLMFSLVDAQTVHVEVLEEVGTPLPEHELT